MARTRTTKKLAQRVDLNYFKRPTPLKRAKFWLSLLLPLLAIAWISWYAVRKDARVYSSGRMSGPHAILENNCAACHVQKTSAFSAKADNQACLSCHDGPIHHVNQIATPDCASCHTEHRGRVNIAAVSEKSCATCHGNLQTSGVSSRYFAHIQNFAGGHPEFAVLRENRRDTSTIKLNHAIHMKPIRRDPTGPLVQLVCGDCHRPAAVKNSWKFNDAGYQASASTTGGATKNASEPNAGTLAPHAPSSGRELMAPVTFANSCASCHLLSFDKHFNQGVPHDQPEVVRAFLKNRFQEYATAHPSELRSSRDPDRDLTGKPLEPRLRTLTASQWVAERTADAEQLLWRKTCLQCHRLSFSSDNSTNAQLAASRKSDDLPRIAESNITPRWMPHARFDHQAHGSFTCASCHEKALHSVDSTEVLLPGIATCQTCHAPGPDHAESRCFECHTYHDWSQRKEITPAFAFPPLKTGGH